MHAITKHALLLLALLIFTAPLARTEVVSRGKVDGSLHVPPPRSSSFLRQSSADASSLWTITYPNVEPPAYVKDAVNYATQLISRFLVIRYPIRAQFVFARLGSNSQGSQILGQARSAVWWPLQNASTYESIPLALANTMSRSDVIADWDTQVDISATFNADAPFYYATDDSKPPAGEFDFVSILMHELLHGMGFIGGFYCKSGCEDPMHPLLAPASGFSDYLPAYDLHVVNGAGVRLAQVYRAQGSLGLAQFYANSRLYFRTDDGDDVELFVPRPYLEGTSLYHLAERYGSGGDSLMRYAIAPRDVIHSLGPATLRVMQSVGWELQPAAQELIRVSLSSSAAFMPPFLLMLSLALTLELYYLYLA